MFGAFIALWLALPAGTTPAYATRPASATGTACVLVTESIDRIFTTHPGQIFFSWSQSIQFQTGDSIFVSDDCSSPSGTFVDDELIADVTHPNGTKQTFTHDYSGGCSGTITHATSDVTSLFRAGNNNVRIRFKELCGGGSGSDDVYLVIQMPCTKTGTTASETLNGTPGNDVICGKGGKDKLNGGGGNDIIIGGPDDDTVDGGSGNDTIYGMDGCDKLSGGPDSDKVYGGDGDNSGDVCDVLDGEGGSDRLFGEGGVNDLNGGPGNDQVMGGPDDDFIVESDGPNSLLDGGGGSDNICGSDEKDVITGGPGNDKLAGNLGRDHIDGGSGNDDVFGNSGNAQRPNGDLCLASLRSDAGNILIGGTGDDFIQGDDHGDHLVGGPGSDKLEGAAGADILIGGTRKDVLNGGRDNDILKACDGVRDSVIGGPGASDSAKVDKGVDDVHPDVEIVVHC